MRAAHVIYIFNRLEDSLEPARSEVDARPAQHEQSPEAASRERACTGPSQRRPQTSGRKRRGTPPRRGAHPDLRTASPCSATEGMLVGALLGSGCQGAGLQREELRRVCCRKQSHLVASGPLNICTGSAEISLPDCHLVERFTTPPHESSVSPKANDVIIDYY